MVEFLLNNGADAGYRDFESLETCLHITAASMSVMETKGIDEA